MDECVACLGALSAVSGRTINRFSILAMLVFIAWPGLAQERTMMPVTIDGEQVQLATIVYKPVGEGPFPTLIFHHGSTGPTGGVDPSRYKRRYEPYALAHWFVSRGWAVVLPSRRGRGGSEGLYDEGFGLDRPKGYTCEETRTIGGANRALHDVDAATVAILALPFVDRTRLLVGGHSRGAILALAWAGEHPDQPRGVVNFAGGWLGAGCPTASAVNQSLLNRGAAFARPTLWIYADHDPYYPLGHSRDNFERFIATGGKGMFHAVGSGHSVEELDNLWSELLEAYLAELGLPFAAIPQSQLK
jgi:dienelactone hydrolase